MMTRYGQMTYGSVFPSTIIYFKDAGMSFAVLSTLAEISHSGSHTHEVVSIERLLFQLSHPVWATNTGPLWSSRLLSKVTERMGVSRTM